MCHENAHPYLKNLVQFVASIDVYPHTKIDSPLEQLTNKKKFLDTRFTLRNKKLIKHFH